jgi:hypothetical protein
MKSKSERLEQANQDRAEAAVRMESAENRADETGAATDKIRAGATDRDLAAADRRIKAILREP